MISAPASAKTERPVLDLSKGEFRWPLIFMLSAVLLGLKFYPAILAVLAVLLNRWRHDRYDCAIMTFIFLGAFGLNFNQILPGVKTYDLGLLLGLGCMVFLRKPRILKIILVMFAAYAAVLFYIATCSWETMAIQSRILRYYFSFVTLFIPLAIFAGEPFDIRIFFRRLMPYVLLMCVFYIVDAIIFKGDILAPANFRWDGQTSTFLHPQLSPFQLRPHRKYPYGLYIMALAVIPTIRCYRLKWWQWGLLALAALVSQTFTFISGLVAAYILFQGSFKRIAKIVGISLGALVVLYFIDTRLPHTDTTTDRDMAVESRLRIQSSIDQIFMVFQAVDDEDLAEFGSGRFAQVLPKVDLISYYHKEMVGLGFLHPELTTNDKLIIVNEYYIDYSNNEEVAAEVEIIPVQIYVHAGWLGLTVHFLFFVGLYFVVRRLRWSVYYLCVLFCTAWFGLGGFASLAGFQGQHLVAFALAVVILENRPELPGFSGYVRK